MNQSLSLVIYNAVLYQLLVTISVIVGQDRERTNNGISFNVGRLKNKDPHMST